ncbi:hypothetical protein ACMWFI_23850, partial [Klebsiella pneumoniae]
MTTMPQRESTIAVPDDRRKQLGAFLRARRESLDPQRLGLPRVGRRRLFMWGVALFGIASLLCGMANSIG